MDEKQSARALAIPMIVHPVVVRSASTEEDLLVVVDGQQRITTSLILFASLRDTCEGRMLLCSREAIDSSWPLRLLSPALHREAVTTFKRKFGGDAASEQHREMLCRVLKYLRKVESVANRALFRDVAAYKTWLEAITKETDVDGIVPVGAELPFSRLSPSYTDRKPFLDIVCGLRGSLFAKQRRKRKQKEKQRQKKEKKRKLSSGSDVSDGEDGAVARLLSEETICYLTQAYECFNQLIDNQLQHAARNVKSQLEAERASGEEAADETHGAVDAFLRTIFAKVAYDMAG